MPIELSRLESPLGRLVLAVRDGALCALEFADDDGVVLSRLARWYPGDRVEEGEGSRGVAERVRRYFAGELAALDDIRVDLAGTDFQKRVWAALRRIPVGSTVSYRAIAAGVGNPKGVRAVGLANGRNPVALVVPCHRVIASDGTLCGYGGGLWRKEWLLRHERALSPESQPSLLMATSRST